MNEQEIQDAIGKPLYGTDGTKIGKVAQAYFDDATGRPEWVTVSTGLLGKKENFVPVAQARYTGQGLEVPYDKDTIQSAPSIEAEEHLSRDEEEDLYRHYSLELTESPSGLADEERPAGEDQSRGEDRLAAEKNDASAEPDSSGPGSDGAMTRSEEHLNVGTEKVSTGKARLRKFVVTEQENITVPVTKERVRLEREPVTETVGSEALEGPEISEAEHEVVLHEERPVVTKETKPVERVRMDIEADTEDQEISEEVRKEKIEAEGVANAHGEGADTDRR